ncbi:alpha/beta fold hydrolase [Nonomuraea sp. NPDC050536]|uniref:alpha/beta fold hydrolase n=1 Tax=Nonomuraea sp. NPDC050536 TaxID=3364366 RepID=UPI0037CA8DF5
MNGLHLTDHTFRVPLDHADPDSPAIEVFARAAVDPARSGDDLPWLVYLQGGPGGRSPRPLGPDGWLARALRTHRVLLLDQRGTGRSTPVTPCTPGRLGSQEALARYLRHFRADSIVADCERIRQALEVERWETLGQSYGGFVTMTYLSRAPKALKACYVTGGLPGLTATADEVYERTYPRVAEKVRRFHRRYPEDAERMRAIEKLLDSRDVRLPDGDRLTVRRLRTLGLGFGMGAGFERVHWLLEDAWDGDELSPDFRYQVMQQTGFTGNPLFAVLQESIYGRPGEATAWAADRAFQDLPFTGEMIYPWMFEEIASLRPYAGAAHLLAHVDDWPDLYDLERLASNQVPVAAAVYHDDMYVDAGLSLETAAAVGNVRAWVTNEWEHDGVTASGEQVLDRLIQLAL